MAERGSRLFADVRVCSPAPCARVRTPDDPRAVRGADRLSDSLNLDHLYRLTDSTGIYQHARGSRPNREFGYCLDDNARALIVAIRAHVLTCDNGLLDYVRHYLAFVESCQRPDGHFHNFISAEGNPMDAVGSEDSHGRAIWALAFAALQSPQLEVRARALHCLDRSLEATAQLSALRARAFVLMGLEHWRLAEPAGRLDELAEQHALALVSAHTACGSAHWNWYEDELSYENARLPQALLVTPGYATLGMETLAWLCQVMEVGGRISLIGCKGWYPRGGQRFQFDQQPVDAAALVAACLDAYRRSGEDRFRRWGQLAHDWFTGGNVGGRSLIDPETGGCYDGLTQDGVNTNQGAESLLAWLLASEDMAEWDR